MEDYTEYDIKPQAFLNYLRYYGPHFNRKLCDFACQRFARRDFSKENLDSMLQTYSIQLTNNKLYDYVYLTNWCKNILFGSSITDEKHLLLFIKDILDKESQFIFNRWYADMAKSGIPIDWEQMI